MIWHELNWATTDYACVVIKVTHFEKKRKKHFVEHFSRIEMKNLFQYQSINQYFILTSVHTKVIIRPKKIKTIQIASAAPGKASVGDLSQQGHCGKDVWPL